ncbi:hypothetical protein HPGCJGGD_0094 [Methylobacterium haplocladii]|nr:hypothetical protein HPGCJGGD_0094 [Methylobacterium haplocladii]
MVNEILRGIRAGGTTITNGLVAPSSRGLEPSENPERLTPQAWSASLVGIERDDTLLYDQGDAAPTTWHLGLMVA